MYVCIAFSQAGLESSRSVVELIGSKPQVIDEKVSLVLWWHDVICYIICYVNDNYASVRNVFGSFDERYITRLHAQ